MSSQKFTLTVSFLAAALLGGCSSQYQVSTNLDEENFREYFSPTRVKIYQNEQEFPGDHRYIGLVEGQDCQLKPHHAAADEINARTEARRQADEKKANAVIFTGCTEIKSAQCISLRVCYAKAYQVLGQ
ncbi:Rcs stress response system protein RcsF [Thalassomonas actiniarum]|uniref:RcsF protein n=1 Tax=Thalassomonas actiniarum TaxID=485447 RepID=A0AAE9YVJ8_9GAMM|nr:Rcs stress response system protein RcsF [Thalassomonas actiniarum]WDE01372.1 rcsF protein [Thalassomonas actiniarum]